MEVLNNLSKTDKEILNLMTNDIRIKDIGGYLNMSTSKVEKTLSDLRYLFGVNTNHELMVEYFHLER